MTEEQRAYFRRYYHLYVGPKKRTGKPVGRPPSGLSPFDRVMARVSKEANSCWLWTGPVLRGYGSMFVSRAIGPRRVHRIVWEHLRGEIPPGLQLDHLCRNRCCVNPDHLEPVTPRENTMRSDAFTAHNARKTACNKGHEFTPENTNMFNGHRQCRTCCKAANKRLSEKRKAARHARGLLRH